MKQLPYVKLLVIVIIVFNRKLESQPLSLYMYWIAVLDAL